MKYFAFFIILLYGFLSIQCRDSETIKLCCSFGTDYYLKESQCTDINEKNLPTGLQNDSEFCLQSMNLCCKKRERQDLCSMGMQVAKTTNKCIFETSNYVKETCCDSCLLGIQSGKINGNCDEDLSSGESFVSCCREEVLSLTNEYVTTSTAITTISTTSTKYSNFFPAIPAMENDCDIEGICAQICIPLGNTHKCECNKGYTLMADGISCKQDKKTKKGIDRCESQNPCEQECTDLGDTLKCSCRDGYELDSDKRTCNDIDECELNLHDCTGREMCLNEVGTYYCDDPSYTEENDYNRTCPPGLKFNGEKNVCDDINECDYPLICTGSKVCINTLGSYKCEEDDIPECPPGFYYNASYGNCSDIDECLTEDNHCNKESQICLNTKGNYTCLDKASKNHCPPGFKKNIINDKCEDINECLEDLHNCKSSEECVNEEGSYTCIAKPATSTHKTTLPMISSTQTPFTSPIKVTKPPTKATKPTTKKIPKATPPPPITCQRGYKLFKGKCIDIDECLNEETCASNQNCFNTPGSYKCECKIGYYEDPFVKACIDVNECQLGSHNCLESQRCDNTAGSYHCTRITGCGTGYTYNYANELCEDDNECLLGIHNCQPGYKCRNTLGSYRCDAIRRSQITTTTYKPYTWIPNFNFTSTTRSYPSNPRKRCLPGFRMNYKGECEDINECESNPCRKGESCLNLQGRYECMQRVHCKVGYELNDAGDGCVDVNECSRNTHKCNPTQICRNWDGYYTCECPPGHHLDPDTTQCKDIDECRFYRVCFHNANCVNTIGSYKCECKPGFKDVNGACQDIDECAQDSTICQDRCINVWGSYRCACQPGFVLNSDNRTCTDVDECERFKDKKLCIGTCQNIPGSYKCTCPPGYRLGLDGRTCQDIDECERNPCENYDDICVNTRGSYKCYTLVCPRNYIRDMQHKSICKRPQNLCDPRDYHCILMPEHYTYHFITIVSNLPILNGHISLFRIEGPKFMRARAEFSFKILHVYCTNPKIVKIDENFFHLQKDNYNTMGLYLTKSIQGPQEAEVEIQMQLFDNNQLTMSKISRIFIIVTEYPF